MDDLHGNNENLQNFKAPITPGTVINTDRKNPMIPNDQFEYMSV